jgi:hypothetical protein
LQGCVTELGRFVAEELSASLAESGKGIQIVDRTNLRVILQENKLAATGIIDPSTARRLGQLAGVDSLITGTLTPFGDSVRVAVKVIDSATAKIIAAARGDIARTKAIDDLLSRGVTGGCPPSLSTGTDTDSGSNSAPLRLPTASGAPAEPQGQNRQTGVTTEAQDFRFTVQICKLSGAIVTCSLTVQNENTEDRDVVIDFGRFGPSRLIDNRGRETKLEMIRFGGKAEGGVTLISGVPTDLQLVFEGVDQSISSIALLDLSCAVRFRESGKRQPFGIQLRQVPIEPLRQPKK